MAFHTKQPKTRQPPTQITSKTPAPKTNRAAQKYPDADEWALAHDEEISKIDTMKAIKWLPNEQIPQNARPIPLTMTYRYKRDPDGDITERKAQRAVRGDLMLPGIHYDPNNTSTFAADKTTIRIIIGHAAAHHLPAEHLDISSAFHHSSTGIQSTSDSTRSLTERTNILNMLAS